jgi:hypothetical protein
MKCPHKRLIVLNGWSPSIADDAILGGSGNFRR